MAKTSRTCRRILIKKFEYAVAVVHRKRIVGPIRWHKVIILPNILGIGNDGIWFLQIFNKNKIAYLIILVKATFNMPRKLNINTEYKI